MLTISTNINQQIYLLNEKIRAVLSLAFQHFHTIFEEFNRVHEHFQHELDQQLKIVIEQLAIDMRNDLEGNQGKFTEIEADLSLQMKTCFQQMV